MPLQTVEPQRLYRQIAEQLRSLIGGRRVRARLAPAGRTRPGQAAGRQPPLGARGPDCAGGGRLGRGAHRLGRLCAGPPARKPAAKAGNATPGLPPTEWGPLELIRARRVVEGEIAAIAATAGQAPRHRRHGPAIDAMRADADQGVMPLDGDRAFHTAIVQASGNVRAAAKRCRASGIRAAARCSSGWAAISKPCDSWRSAIAEHEAIHACHPRARRRGRPRRHAPAPGQIPCPIQRELAPRQPSLT
jgi:hypothetical protein